MISLSAWTWAAWIYPRSFGPAVTGGNYGRILSKEPSGVVDHYFLLNDDTSPATFPRCLGLDIYNSANAGVAILSSANSIILNAWQHVAATYDDATDRLGRLYINGVEASYAAQPAVTGTLLATSNPWTIGNRAAGDRGFDGYIDDVYAYNVALAASDIAALMGAAPIGPRYGRARMKARRR